MTITNEEDEAIEDEDSELEFQVTIDPVDKTMADELRTYYEV